MISSLSIIIPAYNEAERLGSTLSGIAAYLARRNWDFQEILVIDDGSADHTGVVAAQFPGTCVLRNPGNRGKGYSVRRGMLVARGDWLLFSDADLSTPIEEIEKLAAALERDGARIAIGSRALSRGLIGVRQPLMRETSGRVFNLLMRAITGLPFLDTQCGFKLFEANAAREIFSRQTLDGFGFDVEVLAIAAALGIRATEVPVRWNDVAGTKVSLSSGAGAFADLLRVRLNLARGLYRKQ